MHQRLKMNLLIELLLKTQLVPHYQTQIIPKNEPEIFTLVKTFQIHSHSRTCWKYKKNKCRFSYGPFFFSDRTTISMPLDDGLSSEQKNYILNWQKTVLEKVEEYIDHKLYPSMVMEYILTKKTINHSLQLKKDF